ncbi:MAG: GNAT family N-acetyltransferase [Cyanobacteria bacterium]|nr:GNAT family N-acetyltransferase [Cyanobacteriota bacterium]
MNTSLSPLVFRADVEHLEKVALLMDAYRSQCHQPRDLPEARYFLLSRFSKEDSIFFLAEDPQSDEALGFLQLIPSFSTVSLRSLFSLLDIYIAPHPQGEQQENLIAEALLQEALAFANLREDIALEVTLHQWNARWEKTFQQLGFLATPGQIYAKSLSS